MKNRMEAINKYIMRFRELIQKPNPPSFDGNLKVGVDLGTATIVISVLSGNNQPIACSYISASVIRDGLVVDYTGAVDIVRKLKKEMEDQLGVTLMKAAGAIPPGTLGKNKNAISNVLEDAMFEVTNIVDEPTAAASVLEISNGAVVDVGGGTTGISIIKNGDVIYTADEATGGTHMSLVLAGSKQIPFDEAEELKKNLDKSAEIFPIIKPVAEKMASITSEHIQKSDIKTIYLVGGASSFHEFKNVFESETGLETIKPVYPYLVTPLGVAMNC